MRALGPGSRLLVTAAAFASFASAFAAVPLAARNAGDNDVPAFAPVARSTVSARPRDVLPRRDPFEGGAVAVRSAPPSPAPVTANALPPMPPSLLPLPPNAGAGTASSALGDETVRIRAVITGPRPYAVADDAGGSRLITVGDELGGEPVTAITAAGVRLRGGRVVGVTPPHAARQGGPP